MTNPIDQRKPILIVEDNCEDYEATVRALRKVGVKNEIRRCEDGDEALDYLFRRGGYARPESAPRPGLVLLDLNLPGTDGFEVLAAMKTDATLKKTPVTILSTSAGASDVQTCYESGANSYMQKPVDLEGFVEAVRRFKEYWFKTAILP